MKSLDLTRFHEIFHDLKREISDLQPALKAHGEEGLNEYLNQAKLFLDTFEKRANMTYLKRNKK